MYRQNSLSLSSHAPSVIDGAEATNFYNGYATHTSKIGTPEESGFGYQQLPSPLEDEVLIDSAVLDKEVIRPSFPRVSRFAY